MDCTKKIIETRISSNEFKKCSKWCEVRSRGVFARSKAWDYGC